MGYTHVRTTQLERTFPDAVNTLLRRVGNKKLHLDKRQVTLDSAYAYLAGADWAQNQEVTYRNCSICYVKYGGQSVRAIKLELSVLNTDTDNFDLVTCRLTMQDWSSFCKGATATIPIRLETSPPERVVNTARQRAAAFA